MTDGVFKLFLMELAVYPVIHSLWNWHSEMKRLAAVKA